MYKMMPKYIQKVSYIQQKMTKKQELENACAYINTMCVYQTFATFWFKRTQNSKTSSFLKLGSQTSSRVLISDKYIKVKSQVHGKHRFLTKEIYIF